MGSYFLNVARMGRNSLWHYLLGLFFAFMVAYFGFQFIGIPLANAIAETFTGVHNSVNSKEFQENFVHFVPAIYVASHIAYGCLCAGLCIAVKVFHRRPILTLISADASLQLRRFFQGFGVWFLLISFLTLLEFLMQPSSFVWNFNPGLWGSFFPLALLLTPLQTSTEELLFRGYLLQGLSLILRHTFALITVVSFLFAIVHFGNPEMARSSVWIGLTYFSLGVFLTTITLKDNRLELALGVHAANNLFIALFVNSQDSVLQTPAMILQTVPLAPEVTFVGLLGAIVVFYFIFFGQPILKK